MCVLGEKLTDIPGDIPEWMAIRAGVTVISGQYVHDVLCGLREYDRGYCVRRHAERCKDPGCPGWA